MTSHRHTELDERSISTRNRLGFVGEDDQTSRDWRCWLFATTGIVLMLLAVQFLTGLLLAFYYVPSADHAHTTVSFIEKVLPSGSWIRALHHHGSQWLPLFMFLHLAQLFWRGIYRTSALRWSAAVGLLALVMASGATGYSLPWDVRAFFSTRVAEGIVTGLPVVGSSAGKWLLGGSEISTMTISRFFALHVFVTPFLILSIVGWQLCIRRNRRECAGAAGNPINEDARGRRPFAARSFVMNQLTRNVLMAALVFLLLGLYAYEFPAPLGPSASMAGANYLPRPGLQFIWLYQTLKYVPGSLGSTVGVILPGLVLLTLALLPWLNRTPLKRFTNRPRRNLGAMILLLSFLFVLSMTGLSYLDDRRDPRRRQQLAHQAAEEAAFRNQPFVPSLPNTGEATAPIAAPSPLSGLSSVGPPAAYTKFCATCHGEHGEGTRQGALKFPSLLGVSEKPRRTVDDIGALLNDPKAYGLEPPMKSFATKLAEQEKREIAEWVVKLKKQQKVKSEE